MHQPNNRLLWHVANYTVSNDWPDYKVQTTHWSVEDAKDGLQKIQM